MEIGRISNQMVSDYHGREIDGFSKANLATKLVFFDTRNLGIFRSLYFTTRGWISHQDSEKLSELREEKEILNNTLKDLTIQSEAAVCMGEELVVPSVNVDDLMPPQNASEVVAKLEKSVVLILSENGFGSGFFVTPSKIVTNGHVVQDAATNGSEVFVFNENIGVHRAKVSDIQFSGDYAEDFALLSINEQVGIPLT